MAEKTGEAAPRTREPQYHVCLDIKRRQGLASFGLMSNQAWHEDPRHLLFVMSRYKFVAKMLSGRRGILEVGCADAFGTRLVLQEVKELTAIDFDPVFIQDVEARMDPRWPFVARVHDMLEGPVPGSFDGAYALDVLEHIPQELEIRFIGNIVRSLTPHGVLIIGMPSIQSQAFASKPSREGHVNCMDDTRLRQLTSRFFHNTFIFSMNDEVVHTGYAPMAHYLLAVCCSRREEF
jgi:SAM-dependent methyltransferase